MIIKNGDTVKITKPLIQNRGLVGRTGTVLSVDDWNESCRVDITWDAPEDSGWTSQGVLTSFLFDELELVESVDEYGQIIKIADVLHKSGRYDNVPWVEIKKDAADLYKAGIRFNG